MGSRIRKSGIHAKHLSQFVHASSNTECLHRYITFTYIYNFYLPAKSLDYNWRFNYNIIWRNCADEQNLEKWFFSLTILYLKTTSFNEINFENFCLSLLKGLKVSQLKGLAHLSNPWDSVLEPAPSIQYISL